MEVKFSSLSEDAKEWLSTWFYEVLPWIPEMVFVEHYAWIKCWCTWCSFQAKVGCSSVSFADWCANPITCFPSCYFSVPVLVDLALQLFHSSCEVML